jgi:hypothetical protein
VIETTGAGALFTETEMVAVAWFPEVPNAVAERLCKPLELNAVFQVAAYGGAVTVAPIGTLSTKNWTPLVVPWVKAVTLTFPLTELPFEGAFMATPSIDEPGIPWPFKAIPEKTAKRIHLEIAERRHEPGVARVLGSPSGTIV